MTSCEFHRKAPAKWSCSSCNTSYCHECVPVVREAEKDYCPVCINTLEKILIPANRPIWEQLGMPSALSIGRKSSDMTPLPNVLYKAHVLRKDGKNQEAIKYLSNHLSQESSIDNTHIETRELYHQLLKQEQHLKEMLRHGKEYISILISYGIPKKAFPIYRDCIKTDRTFRLKFAEQTFTLCKAAYNAMDYRLFLAASNGFANHYPDFDGIVELYLMMAKTLSEEYRKDRQALDILKFLLKKYPDHELISEVEKQKKLFNKLELGATS
ncbi:MAG: hypothetical protein ABUK11_01210 [Mariprofundaceae bacterium]